MVKQRSVTATQEHELPLLCWQLGAAHGSFQVAASRLRHYLQAGCLLAYVHVRWSDDASLRGDAYPALIAKALSGMWGRANEVRVQVLGCRTWHICWAVWGSTVDTSTYPFPANSRLRHKMSLTSALTRSSCHAHQLLQVRRLVCRRHDMRIGTAPADRPLAASLATARAAGGSASIAMVMSLAATHSAVLAATLAPSCCSSLHLSGERIHTVTWYPAFNRFLAYKQMTRVRSI